MKAMKLIAAALIVGVTGCTDADIVSENLSKAADNFEIMRRIVVVNGITSKYELEVIGRCSLGNTDGRWTTSITCKTGEGAYKKHIIRNSDNVFTVSEQLDDADTSVYHYRVTFKPQSIIPDVDFRGDAGELTRDRND